MVDPTRVGSGHWCSGPFLRHRGSRSPRPFLWFAVLSVVLRVLASPAAARPAVTAAAPADGDAAAAVLDTVVVSAPAVRSPGLFPSAPGVATVVPLEDATGGADLAELLAGAAGLQMRRFGGLGAYALPSVRGSSAAQVEVLIDGLPLGDAQTGVVDLSALPLERFDRAEIHRGLVPAGFGGVGAAGAIDLRTRDIPGGRLDVRLFGGSFGDRGARATVAGATSGGGLRGMLLLHGRATDNRFRYLDHHQTFLTTADDTIRDRVNAERQEAGFYGLGELDGGTGTLRASAGFFRQDAGRPGPLGFPSPHAGLRRDRWDGRLTAATPRRDVTLDLAASRRRETLADGDGEVGWDPPGDTQATSDEVTARAMWAPVWLLSDLVHDLPDLLLSLTAGGDWRQQEYRATQPDRTLPRRERTTTSAFASLAIDMPHPRLRVTPGWRWQRARDDFPPVPDLPWLPEGPAEAHVSEATSPSLGLTWQAVPGALTLDAHWHETVRQPTWVELFGEPGGLEGNRELQPEAITGRDVGVTMSDRDAGTALRVTVFSQTTERTITWLQSSLYTVKPVNIGRAQTRGVEVEARGRFLEGLALTANVTAQRARDRGPDPAYRGKALPYLPSLELFATISLDRDTGWVPTVTVQASSSNPRDRYNQPEQRAPARSLVHLALARTWRGGVWGAGRVATLTGEIMNVTDNTVTDVEGYPLPGRSVRVSLAWR